MDEEDKNADYPNPSYLPVTNILNLVREKNVLNNYRSDKFSLWTFQRDGLNASPNYERTRAGVR
jgi:hypothetical protein